MKTDKKKLCFVLVGIFLFSSIASAVRTPNESINDDIKDFNNSFDSCLKIQSCNLEEDIDPLVDLEVTVTIHEIRALDEIDDLGNADFFVVVYINDEKFKTKTYKTFPFPLLHGEYHFFYTLEFFCFYH